ncbi:MAG TPA: hypothetical protein DCL41_02295, partial [Bdellovibrionales bacterium]|nr:hypothetical protein [Bdellovibrionales bacterium]
GSRYLFAALIFSSFHGHGLGNSYKVNDFKVLHNFSRWNGLWICLSLPNDWASVTEAVQEEPFLRPSERKDFF